MKETSMDGELVDYGRGPGVDWVGREAVAPPPAPAGEGTAAEFFAAQVAKAGPVTTETGGVYEVETVGEQPAAPAWVPPNAPELGTWGRSDVFEADRVPDPAPGAMRSLAEVPIVTTYSDHLPGAGDQPSTERWDAGASINQARAAQRRPRNPGANRDLSVGL